MAKIKLKWKIFAYLLGFCSLLLVILWLFQNVLLYDMYKFIRSREMDQAIVYVQKNIDNPELFFLLDDLFREKEIMVTKTAEYVPSPTPGFDGRGGPRQETITKEETFTTAKGETLSLTFHAIITPVDATVTTLRLQLYLVTAILIFMSVLMAIVIAKRVSRPLEELNRSAKILAKGDYEVSFAGRGFLEIEELSSTLNTTAAELAKVESLRRELLANVSHDLRTPLSLIYSYAELMHDFPREIAPKHTQTIMTETNRLTSLVNDMLDLSKLESGMTELKCSIFNLTAVLGQMTKGIAELVKQDGYTIDFQFDNQYYVCADEVKITQAYYNLLVNAFHYCGEHRRVEVRQSAAGGEVKIEIIDHGAGIDPQELPYIWERYYKSRQSHKRAVTGSGIGLSIVRKIFEVHHLDYGVYSQVGSGSIFWFRLRIVQPKAGEF